MKRRESRIILHNPSAADVKFFDGLVYLGPDWGIGFDPTCMDKCEAVCESPCTKGVTTITFHDVDFGDCQSCGKKYSISFWRNPNAIGDIETHRSINAPNVIQLPMAEPSGIVSAADQAQAYAAAYAEMKQKNLGDWYVESVVASGNTIIITSYCDYVNQILLIQEGLETAEKPTIAITVAPIMSVDGLAERTRANPLMQDYIEGQGVHPTYFAGCEGYCNIYISQNPKQCIENGVMDLDPKVYHIMYNGLASGVAAFKNELIARFPAVCTTGTLAAVPVPAP